MTQDSPELLRIGKVVTCHGLRGELTVRPVSEDPDWLEDLERAILIHPVLGRKELPILGIRSKGGDILILFETIRDRTEAEKWKGAEVQAYTEDLPEPEEDAFRVHELIGRKVLDFHSKAERGTVLDVVTSSGSDFLEIQPVEGDSYHPVVIPFNNEFFPELDLENNAIYLDKLENLLELTTPVSAQPKNPRPVKSKRKKKKPAPAPDAPPEAGQP